MCVTLDPENVLNYKLGSLKYFSADKLFNDPERDSQDGIILALALAYNDLKDTLFFWDVLDQNKPSDPKDKISARFGQYSGMRWHTFRFLNGIIHEILYLIEENQSEFEKPYIKAVIKKLDKQRKTSWNFLNSITTTAPIKDPELKKLRTLLIKLRSNVAYHYHQPKVLSKDYKEFFLKGGLPSENKKAYFCDGKTIEQTRFMFADAAVEKVLLNNLNEFSKEHEQIFRDLLKLVSLAIIELVTQYLKQIQCDIYLLGDANKLYES